MAQASTRIRYALLEPAHLGALALALVALIVTGFSATAILVVFVLELLYLVAFAQTRAYDRRANLKDAAKARLEREEKLSIRAAQLNRDDRRRYQALEKRHATAVQQLEQGVNDASDLFVDRDKLDGLKAAALEFCIAQQNFRNILKDAPATQAAASQPPSSEEGALQQEALDKRQAHLEKVRKQMAELEAQLQSIEQALEQMSTLGVQERLPAEVGRLVDDVEATRRTVQEMQSFEVAGR